MKIKTHVTIDAYLEGDRFKVMRGVDGYYILEKDVGYNCINIDSKADIKELALLLRQVHRII